MNLNEAIARQASVFMSDLLGSSYAVNSGITHVINEGMSFGYYAPEDELKHLIKTNCESLTEIQQHGEKRFFDVLCGSNTVGQFVEEIFTIAAVYRRDLKKKETGMMNGKKSL